MKYTQDMKTTTKMKTTVYLFTLMFVLCLSISHAQPQPPSFNQERWEKIKAEKIAFLTEKLELTPVEAQKFWPLYNQMEKEKWDAQKKRREMEDKVNQAKENLSEKDIINLTREYTGGFKKEAEMVASYNEEFLKVISGKKVLKLYQAENEFRMHMIKKFRDEHGKRPDDSKSASPVKK